MSSEDELAEARRQIDELRAALDKSDARAQSVNDEMQHFVYAISHDLRQPLRTISTFTQLLKRQHAADAETSELTTLIADGVNEMNTLIEEILKYSRINISPARTMVNLSSVVQWAWLNLQKQVHDSGAEISYKDLPEIPIDEAQFVQLFQQLFSNALKFGGGQSPRVEVTAEATAEECMISVRDNGIGIEPKYHELIFTPFKRLHGREVPGIGLGLAICRKIMRAHAGKIWVESEAGRGSLFRMTLPV